jgi:hypothetical protein
MNERARIAKTTDFVVLVMDHAGFIAIVCLTETSTLAMAAIAPEIGGPDMTNARERHCQSRGSNGKAWTGTHGAGLVTARAGFIAAAPPAMARTSARHGTT